MYNKNVVGDDLNESNVVLFTISPPQQIEKKKKNCCCVGKNLIRGMGWRGPISRGDAWI